MCEAVPKVKLAAGFKMEEADGWVIEGQYPARHERATIYAKVTLPQVGRGLRFQRDNDASTMTAE